MPRKRKFWKGPRIEDWNQLARLLNEGHWVYWHDKPKHHGFIRSMHFHTLNGALEMGMLHEAVPVEDSCSPAD